jgi:hypothetical protein
VKYGGANLFAPLFFKILSTNTVTFPLPSRYHPVTFPFILQDSRRNVPRVFLESSLLQANFDKEFVKMNLDENSYSIQYFSTLLNMIWLVKKTGFDKILIYTKKILQYLL